MTPEQLENLEWLINDPDWDVSQRNDAWELLQVMRAELSAPAQPAQGWRLLEVGEVIQAGDEFWDDNVDEWCLADRRIYDKTDNDWPFRRRLSQPAEGQASDSESSFPELDALIKKQPDALLPAETIAKLNAFRDEFWEFIASEDVDTEEAGYVLTTSILPRLSDFINTLTSAPTDAGRAVCDAAKEYVNATIALNKLEDLGECDEAEWQQADNHYTAAYRELCAAVTALGREKGE